MKFEDTMPSLLMIFGNTTAAPSNADMKQTNAFKRETNSV